MKKIILNILLVNILLTLILNIISNRIDNYFEGENLYLSISYFLNNIGSIYYFAVSLIILIIFLFIIRIVRIKKFRENYRYFLPAHKSLPIHFNIPKYFVSKIKRKSDDVVHDKIYNGQNVLITGRQTIGKTRTAFDEISKLKNTYILIPEKDKEININQINHPFGIRFFGKQFLCKNKIIIYCDDINTFNCDIIYDIFNKLKSENANTSIIATCRNGINFNEFRENFSKLFYEFSENIVEIDNISLDDANLLKNEIGKPEVQLNNFDGTPGFVTMGLHEMITEYNKLNSTEQSILKSIKIQYLSNNTQYHINRIKDLCNEIWKIEKIERFDLEYHLEKLLNKGFLSKIHTNGLISAYEAYLEYCVDYLPSKYDYSSFIKYLKNIKDSGGLNLLGRSLNQRKEFELAIECFDFAISIYNNYASALTGKGYALAKLGELFENKLKIIDARINYNKAISCYQMAIEINKTFAVNYNNLGYTYTRLGELCEDDKNEQAKNYFQEAYFYHSKAIEYDERYSAAYFSRAYVRTKLDDKEGYISDIKKAIELKPDSAYSYRQLAYFYANTEKNFIEAEKNFKKALELEPEFPNALVDYAHMLKQMPERMQEAIDIFENVIQTYPDIIRVYVILGRIYVTLKNYSKGIDLFKKANFMNTEYTEPYIALGWAYSQISKFSEAKEVYEKVLELAPSNYKANQNFGYLLSTQANMKYVQFEYDASNKLFQKAILYLDKALQIEPDNIDSYRCITMSLEKWFKYKKAKHYYDIAIRENIVDDDFLYQYAHFLHKKLNEFEKSIAILSDLYHKTENSRFLNKINGLNSEELFYKISNIAENISEYNVKDKLITERLVKDFENELDHILSLKFRTQNIKAQISKGIILECYGDLTLNQDEKNNYYSAAESKYQSCINPPDRYHSPHYRLGVLYTKKMKYYEAEKEFMFVEKIAPYHAKNIRDYGNLLLKLNRVDEAKLKYYQAIELFDEQDNQIAKEKTFKLITAANTRYC